MNKANHSYIAFYPSDWLGGTAGLPRLHKSVYLDVCLFNWDKARAMPMAAFRMMAGDMEPAAAQSTLDDLIAAGKLHIDDDGSIYCVRAMAEAEKSAAMWEAKSKGGSKKRVEAPKADTRNTQKPVKQESSKSVPSIIEDTSIEPEPEPDFKPKGIKGDVPSLVTDESKIPREDLQAVVEAWNLMGTRSGLKNTVSKMDAARTKALKARVVEYGVDALLAAIETIPASPFLMGKRGTWKADFDWFVTPKGSRKLMEGSFHNEGDGDQGKASAWQSSE